MEALTSQDLIRQKAKTLALNRLKRTAQPENDGFVTAPGVELLYNWTHAVSPTL